MFLSNGEWMKTLMIALVTLLWIVAASGTTRCGEVVWCTFDTPPLNIPYGPLENTGYSDRFQQDLFQVMNDEHTVITCNIARTLEMFKKTSNVCNSALLYTRERDAFVHYSKPIIGLIPNRLIVLSERRDILKPYLTQKGVDLGRLLRESKLVVGLIRGRAYGKNIDQPLKEADASPFIHRVTQMSVGAKQLFGKRVDLLIAYTQEIAYYQRINKVETKYESFPILGEHFVDVHVGCSDSEQGRTVVEQIDRLLDEGLREAYLRHYLEWVDARSHEAVRAHVAGWPGVK